MVVLYNIFETHVNKNRPWDSKERAWSATRLLSLPCYYSRFLWILPEIVLGNSSRKTTMRGYLYGAVCSLT